MTSTGRQIMIFLLGCGLTISVQAQRSGMELSVGFQSANMDDMHYLQDLYLANYPVPAASVASFPPYLRAGIGYRHQLYPDFQLGISYAFSSTGGRINYTDFSGTMNTDMSLNSNRVMAMASYAILGEKRAVLSAYGKAGLNYSLCEITSAIQIYSGYADFSSSSYHAFSPVVAGGLEFFYHLESLSFGVDASYMADIPGELKHNNSGDPFLDPEDSERTLTSDWTGWQLQLKVILWL